MRSVVVTGASTGIGWAIAKFLVGRGHRVFGSVRKQADADRLKGEFGQNFTPLLFDVTDEAAVLAAARQVREAMGGETLAGLVNNAGVVDEPMERLPAQHLANASRRSEDRSLVGDVEQERREVRAEFTLQTVGIGLFANTAEDAIAAPDQKFRNGPANAGGRTGDDDRSHGFPSLSSRDHAGGRCRRAMPPNSRTGAANVGS